jgi:polyisoprenoid-binding protein YceI
MKRLTLNLLIVLLVTAVPFSVLAQKTYQVKSQNMVVSGTSNLHDWTANVSKANGSAQLEVNNGKITSIQNVEIKVDAQSLKGSKGNIMDSKIKDALDAKKNPTITYKASKGSLTEQSGTYKITTNGSLTIAGVTQNVTLDASGKVLPNGDIEFSGVKKLKMTDYKIDPPTAMLGALTTGNEITLNYKVILSAI